MPLTRGLPPAQHRRHSNEIQNEPKQKKGLPAQFLLNDLEDQQHEEQSVDESSLPMVISRNQYEET